MEWNVQSKWQDNYFVEEDPQWRERCWPKKTNTRETENTASPLSVWKRATQNASRDKFFRLLPYLRSSLSLSFVLYRCPLCLHTSSTPLMRWKRQTRAQIICILMVIYIWKCTHHLWFPRQIYSYFCGNDGSILLPSQRSEWWQMKLFGRCAKRNNPHNTQMKTQKERINFHFGWW